MSKTQSKENVQFVTFKSLHDCFRLNEPFIFRKYLLEIFQDLANYIDKNNRKYIGKMSFYDYINLPIFIAGKLLYEYSYSSGISFMFILSASKLKNPIILFSYIKR